MSKIKTTGTVLKQFQEDAVKNGTAIFQSCLSELSRLSATDAYETNKRLIISDLGVLLLEAPTGVGKTLMAGHIAESISQLHTSNRLPKVIWFWIAPYSGLIDQAVKTIRTEFTTLTTKDVVNDRSLDTLKSGDVFVTTWSGVAVSSEVSRKARTNTELIPSIDKLINFARSKGYVIGTIIDEAHHTFKDENQAFEFYSNVLNPELTILATATPRDRDIDKFTIATGIKNIRKITIARQKAIDAKLIKEGVKVAIFKADSGIEGLIDFKKTALKQAVEVHRNLKQRIADDGLSITPLLLVQVDSDAGSIEQTTEWLKKMGFKTEGDSELIRAHTADEPDPYLSSIAADERVEVLIFKLAVATGFDAPRAFTMVSFRPSRDENFGIQIVGRILRVDRRLQSLNKIPSELNHGYVFLSDKSGQTGLSNAAQRINAVKDELASVTRNVAVVIVGNDEPTAQVTTKGGQTTFLTNDGDIQDSKNAIKNESTNKIDGSTSSAEDSMSTSSETYSQSTLSDEWDLTPSPSNQNEKQNNVKKNSSIVGIFRYPLINKFKAPTVFKRAITSLESIDIVNDIASRFRFDDAALLVAQQSATKVLMENIEIFENIKEQTKEVRAELAQDEIDAHAQMTLLKVDDYGVIHVPSLHQALLRQLTKELEHRGIEDSFDSDKKIEAGLHKILALRPLQLKRAISESIAHYTSSEDAAEIPSVIESFTQLEPATLNLYGIFPDDLNSWEKPFAEYLDNDLTGTVLWWHRNPVKKPYSVCMPLAGQPDFYPDFVVGIQDRKLGKGILLMETKRDINDQLGNAKEKAQAEHPDYGKVMMIYWEDQREWQVVEYDPKKDKNFLDRVLRPELMSTY